MHHLHRLMLGIFQNLVPAHFEFFVEISANQNALIVHFVQEKEENRLILHPFQCCEFVESSRLRNFSQLFGSAQSSICDKIERLK